MLRILSALYFGVLIWAVVVSARPIVRHFSSWNAQATLTVKNEIAKHGGDKISARDRAQVYASSYLETSLPAGVVFFALVCGMLPARRAWRRFSQKTTKRNILAWLFILLEAVTLVLLVLYLAALPDDWFVVLPIGLLALLGIILAGSNGPEEPSDLVADRGLS